MSVKRLESRVNHVKQTVNSRGDEKIEAVVKDLAERLFVSERTIYRDLQRVISKR